MYAMLLDRLGEPLRYAAMPDPTPAAGQLLVRVHACAVCSTDLLLMDGRLPAPKLPLVPGHELVGSVVKTGEGVTRFRPGDRVGVPWLGWTCGVCRFCRAGCENLCESARFTGYQIDGGYADHTVADERCCLPVPNCYDDREAATLLCSGLTGYRALRMTEDAPRIGLYGFGTSAHIVAQVARYEGREVFAFTRPGDVNAQLLARQASVDWVGDIDEMPPEPLDAAIIFAPGGGALVPAALRAVDRGGTVICTGMQMSDIPSFSYEDLCQERTLRSVSNLTRRDAEKFMAFAARVRLHTPVTTMPVWQANEALQKLRNSEISGGLVLVP